MKTPDKYTPVLVHTAVGWLLRFSSGTVTTDNALICYERTDDERFPTAYKHWKHLPYNQGCAGDD